MTNNASDVLNKAIEAAEKAVEDKWLELDAFPTTVAKAAIAAYERAIAEAIPDDGVVYATDLGQDQREAVHRLAMNQFVEANKKVEEPISSLAENGQGEPE